MACVFLAELSPRHMTPRRASRVRFAWTTRSRLRNAHGRRTRCAGSVSRGKWECTLGEGGGLKTGVDNKNNDIMILWLV